MNLPTLSETKDLISKCINSCDTQLEIATCRDMMQTHLKNRYESYVSAKELATTLNILDQEIEERRVVIAHKEGSKQYQCNDFVNVI